MSTWSHLLVAESPPITRITLNRPERRNALSLELIRELRDALRAAEGRVIVIGGAGPAFSAGHDLAEMVECDTAEAAALFDTCAELMTTVQSIPQPVIARVHGVATAAGCQLVASCDLAVAEAGARFATPGVRIGLFCSTPMVPLSRAIGPKRSMQMLLTGDLIDAPTAVDWGLVNEAVPLDALDATVDALATRIAEASPLVLALGKQAFYAQAGLPQADAYELASATMTVNAGTDDAHEGITAFLDKRSPDLDGPVVAPAIRPYAPTDLDALYEICLRTGAAGQDATAMVEDATLFGELWAAPYGVLEPEHALVLDDGDGRAVGYVLGAVDTRAFEARCATDWWPAAQARHPMRDGLAPLDELLVHVIHHPHAADEDVVARYPSHLHIDLLPEVQGAGWGRQMMDALFARLARDGSSGVHWGVSKDNHPALGFYRHLGATELVQDAITHRFAWPLP